MFLNKVFSQGRKEEKVIQNIASHIQLLCEACGYFRMALEQNDHRLMQKVVHLEREGDSIRREIINDIYQGAFLPYIRPDLCKFVEIVDSIFDELEDIATCYMGVELPEELRGECTRVAYLNGKMCEMLLMTFRAMIGGEDLREKTLAVRIYEKKIDDIKFGLMKDVRKVPIENFWTGRMLSEFMTGLTQISDIMEDASDHLQIINVSMR
jgi:uncharacterized protein